MNSKIRWNQKLCGSNHNSFRISKMVWIHDAMIRHFEIMLDSRHEPSGWYNMNVTRCMSHVYCLFGKYFSICAKQVSVSMLRSASTIDFPTDRWNRRLPNICVNTHLKDLFCSNALCVWFRSSGVHQSSN